MLKIGLKLWSKNIEVLSQVRDMHARAIFDYIELYFVPGTLEETGAQWQGLSIPMVIHAPHWGNGFNLADSKCAVSNLKIFEEVLRCADLLRTDTIIVHGGNDGAKRETIRQLKAFKDPRVIIENKPKLGLNGKECIGFAPEDIFEIVRESGLKGFVLDFNHAVCAARSLSRDPLEFIKGFLAKEPSMFHLADGDYFSFVDIHKHLGQGNIPLDQWVPLLPDGARVSLEIPNDFSKGLRDFEDNRVFLDGLLDAHRKGVD